MYRNQSDLDQPRYQDMHETYLQAIEELAKPYPALKMPDWPIWNQIVGGFRAREFSILCGSTGSGKTTFLANMSVQLMKANKKHFVMSVETGHTDYMKRILSVLDGTDLNTGDPVRLELLSAIHTRNSQLLEERLIEFSLYENRCPVEKLLEDLWYMRDKRGCEIAFIDNLNFFMEVTKSADQIVEMDRVIHELIIFCKQVDMHVVMVMHPKKSGQSSDTRVLSEYDIKGSSTAVQEAHNVFLFNRPAREDIEENNRSPSERELWIAKMRRRGKYVGAKIIFQNQNTKYIEKGYE